MQFAQMLLHRESCRSYSDRPVAREDLIKICEAGRLTPSGCNAQPWKFLVVDTPEARAKLCDALVLEDGRTAVPWREECPAYIVLVEQTAKLKPLAMEVFGDSQRFAQGDIGMVSLNMCYQALELGISSCILGMVNREKMHTLFEIPREQEVRLVLAVGYPKEEKPPRAKVRKPFEEVVCFNEWK